MNPDCAIEEDYRTVNRRGWAWLSIHGCEAAVPFGPSQFAQARERLDRNGWLPWHNTGSVLCLACGGGQQGPLFASLGYRVTVVDICSEQLQKDAEVARGFGLDIECVEADMLDLAVLHGRSFDLVYQAVSTCYIPDVARLYTGVKAVLKPGGLYWAEHWNPAHAQLAPSDAWDGEAYRLVYPQQPKRPVSWNSEIAGIGTSCWHYIHPLQDLIGGLGDAGLRIERFAEVAEWDESAEAGSPAHLARYIPSLLRILARRIEES